MAHNITPDQTPAARRPCVPSRLGTIYEKISLWFLTRAAKRAIKADDTTTIHAIKAMLSVRIEVAEAIEAGVDVVGVGLIVRQPCEEHKHLDKAPTPEDLIRAIQHEMGLDEMGPHHPQED